MTVVTITDDFRIPTLNIDKVDQFTISHDEQRLEYKVYMFGFTMDHLPLCNRLGDILYLKQIEVGNKPWELIYNVNIRHGWAIFPGYHAKYNVGPLFEPKAIVEQEDSFELLKEELKVEDQGQVEKVW